MLLLVALEYLSRMGGAWAYRVAAEASLIVVVHLLLRLHMPYIVALRVHIVVAFIVYHLTRVIVQHFGPRVVALEHHRAAGSLFEADARVLLLLA